MSKADIILRSFLSAGACLVFLLAAGLAARQNQSSTQTYPAQSSGAIAEARASLARGDAEDAIRILSSYLQSRPKDPAAWVLLGAAYASSGQNDRAAEVLQSVVQSTPDDYTALAALGEIYEREGQPDKAEPMLARAARSSQSSPQIRIEWAGVLARLHRYKEAQSALTGVSPPTRPEQRLAFHRLKASLALGLGNPSGAAEEMEKALALNPADSQLAMAAAVAELQAKNWQRAASLTEPLFARTHDPQIGLVCLEAQLAMHADFHQTLQLLRSTRLAPTNELAFRQRLAELLVSHGYFSDAVEEFRAAADLDPNQPESQFNLALVQFRAGLFDDALASANRCKELGDSAEIEDLLGDIQEARGDNLAAVKSYQAAVLLAPSEEKYRLSLAVEFVRHENYDAAKVVLKQAEELQPKSWRIQVLRGMVEYFAGTDEQATRYLLRAAELAPEPGSALKYLGDIQVDRPSAPDPDAIARLCEYSDHQPKDGQMQFYCGALLFRRDSGSGDKAHSGEFLRRLRAATVLLPKDASPHCQLGKAYRWLGQWQEALGESQICARMDPDSAEAHYRLAQIYEHAGQREQKQKEIKLYEAASTRVADENARREATMKTFLYEMQKDDSDPK
ncbi:MAG: tetratricopeptide repeat protein [Candidatus Acidiferrales bacterium]